MNLSSGETVVSDLDFEEAHHEAVRKKPESPSIHVALPSELRPPSPVKPDSAETSPDGNSLASAPEKLVMRILTQNSPAASLLSTYKALVASKKLEPKVTPVSLELVDNRTEPRGKMTSDLVSLVVPLTSQSESLKVFAHELGHVVDIRYLTAGRFTADPSEKFYDLSWLDMSTKKSGMALADFVSGYAMTNKYEDFAESFDYYLFHNNDFAKRARDSNTLRAKYEFFQKYVFQDQEFMGTGFEMDPIPKYSWDTTKIPVALNKYLFYIK